MNKNTSPSLEPKNSSINEKERPKIRPLPNGPYYLLNDMKPKTVENLQNSKGEPLSTVHDNRRICSHAAECVNNLPSVFKLNSRPWIEPDAAEVKEIVDTVRKCPSGALSYSIDGVEYRDQNDGLPMVIVSKDGPYVITGRVELIGDNIQFGGGASKEHYTLCRCGASQNILERYATEDMKRDVDELFNVIKEAEAGNKRSQAIKFIRSAYQGVQRYTEYTESIKNQYEHELAVLEITDEDTVARQTADKVLSLLTKYERKDMLIVFESVLRLKDRMVTKDNLVRK